MNSQDQLYKLIHSLSKAEKRYVKVYGQSHTSKGNTNALAVWEAMLSLPGYSTSGLKKALAGHPAAKNLAASRYDLYKTVMRALHNFHYKNSPEAQTDEALHLVKILFQKGLFVHCQKPLRRARKLAEQHHLDLHLIRIIRWETRLMPHLENFGVFVPDEVERLKRVLKQVQVVENEVKMNILLSKMQRFSMDPETKNAPDFQERLEQAQKDELFSGPEKAKSPLARLHFHNLKTLFELNWGSPEKALDHARALVNVFEEFPGLQLRQFDEFVTARTKLVMFQSDAGDYENLLENIQALQEIPRKFPQKMTPAARVRIELRAFHLRFLFYCRNGLFTEGSQLIEPVEQLLKKQSEFVNPGFRILFHYWLSYFSFGSGNFERAAHFTSQAQQFSGLKILPTFQTYTRLVQLLTHVELQNHDFLPYLLRSTYRFMRKNGSLGKLEILLLRFMRKELPQVTDQNSLATALEHLKTELIDLPKRDRIEGNKLLDLDLISWIEAKISRRSFHEVARKRALERVGKPVLRTQN